MDGMTIVDHKCEWKLERDLFKYEDLKEFLGNIKVVLSYLLSSLNCQPKNW